jgi:uncharacterized membrane protein YfcA
MTAPDLVPVCLLVLMLPLNVYVAWRERAALDRQGASWITGGRLIGTFGGLWLLVVLTARQLDVFIGVATIAAAIVSFVMPSFEPGRRSFAVAGVVTGITETATGIGGPPLALVYQHKPPAVLRSTVALCFLVGELISLGALTIAGRTTWAQLATATLLCPALAVGASASRHAHRRVDGRALRAFVLVFAVVSGAVLALRG